MELLCKQSYIKRPKDHGHNVRKHIWHNIEWHHIEEIKADLRWQIRRKSGLAKKVRNYVITMLQDVHL